MNRQGNVHVQVQSQNQIPSHNLDIYSYSFQEVLDLFQLTKQISETDIKRAKLVALKTHPDKSGLPPQYFLFYKKAYDIILEYYRNSQKTQAIVPEKNPEYSTGQNPIRSVQHTISKTKDIKQFNNRFNELYEANMKPANIKSEKYEWFKEEKPAYDNINSITSVSGIHGAIDSLKQNSSVLSKYQGVQELVLPTTASSFYDEEDDENDSYVTCDPFSKLKFDDLRKVHKDQTVLGISERDFDSVKKYGSIDEIRNERGKQLFTSIEKAAAEKLLKEKEDLKKEILLKKQHDAYLKTMRYEEKNSIILSEFLRLGN